MDTFCLYIVFQIVDEITISPPHKKSGKPEAIRASLRFVEFIVAKSSKIE